jgi:hypothetical protein
MSCSRTTTRTVDPDRRVGLEVRRSVRFRRVGTGAREEQVRATRARIADAALELFLGQGYAQTTIDQMKELDAPPGARAQLTQLT